MPEPRRLRPPEIVRLLDSVVAMTARSSRPCPTRSSPGRIRIILASDDAPTLEAWDQDEVARVRRDCGRDATALVDEFAGLLRDSVALVAGLGAADLERGGHHPKVGFLPVGDLLHEWVHHDRNHFRQLLANIQALAWPNMGNARRFSAG